MLYTLTFHSIFIHRSEIIGTMFLRSPYLLYKMREPLSVATTLFGLAVFARDYEFVKSHSNEVKLNAQDHRNSLTPIEMAKIRGDKEMENLLIQLGAKDVSPKSRVSSEGRLDFIAKFGRPDMLRRLISNCATHPWHDLPHCYKVP